MNYLEELNPRQRQAVEILEGPVLVIAGAGSGKTKTLAYRVAHLVKNGVRPETILLLTFTRRAAAEMLRRAQAVIGRAGRNAFARAWGGTFHATANRLLRTYAASINLAPEFTVLDEGDSRDLMDMARRDAKAADQPKRFPQKGTLLAVYSRTVNTGRGGAALRETLERFYPWCLEHEERLTELFRRYIALKQERNLLDYDDLLLFWHELLEDDRTADLLESRFSHILVDEYQDTNPIQARILARMRRHNRNIMVVGDDAQAIYGFRAATVRNILDFPKEFPDATVVTLDQNYRSVQPVLDVTNKVIAYAKERYTKDLWSERASAQKPYLVTCYDEPQQSTFVIDTLLAHREEGVPLRRQAVLFRASQLSANLELELVRRSIPYHKFGGLRYLEAAHVKDLLSFLRVMENGRDDLAWHRMLNLLPGVGQSTAARVIAAFGAGGGSFAGLKDCAVPSRAEEHYGKLVDLLCELHGSKRPLPEEVSAVRKFYGSLLQDLYENAEVRDRDLDHLEALSQRYKSRREFLADLALDPPTSTSDFAADPSRDDDWLVLSTIHSAKGLEFDAVYIIHAADGCLPSDLATSSEEELEEERRLLYVAMTRARNFLYVSFPFRYYSRPFGTGDRHAYAQLTRFIPPVLFDSFERIRLAQEIVPDEVVDAADIQRRIRSKWW
ncbi:MAG TPA: ATP-dependent helicase [Planctomycetota bacterium]|jgi:DNA helicase-2/ATP-dependent DNA helicase PcrA|nr:ATP-dependent helicase [Planctomycetota bacterium]OQC21042.1 MAG: ATP-dependent DNA helicase PcrA [Planctomycetes bacterium ADurb.Bin069]NMD35979.1 ATP-dependent helicase [Planctomycetota bacterium]HNR99432.1 ATP-dependent helicase [Planctomycetota bacterium]HNU25972.1 ATP-dependent helicase [Planctomycetota bacterium]